MRGFLALNPDGDYLNAKNNFMATYGKFFNPGPPSNRRFKIVLTALAALVILLAFLCINWSCNTVKTNKGTQTTYTITDTVHVSTYDTTKKIIETLDFQKKVVEVYDTVYNKKDSLLIVLKTRTIYEAVKSAKDATYNGTGKDSIKVITQTKEVIKWKEKESKRSPFLIYIIIGVAIVAALLLYFMVKKK